MALFWWFRKSLFSILGTKGTIKKKFSDKTFSQAWMVILIELIFFCGPPIVGRLFFWSPRICIFHFLHMLYTYKYKHARSGIRTSVHLRCRIYWMRNWSLNELSHHDWFIELSINFPGISLNHLDLNIVQ